MKRKNIDIDEDEDRLSKLLFNNRKEFMEKMKPVDETVLQFKSTPPAWIDEDDNLFTANKISDTNNKDFYVNTLKQKYVNLMGTPSWARLDKNIKHDNAEHDEILRTVGHLQRKKSNSLTKDFLEIKRFPKINSETSNEGPIINCIEFHPTASVALVGGKSGKVSLFSVGGDKNSKLHSFSLNTFPLLSAHFTVNGDNAFISSKRSHNYCVYNLVKAEPKLIQLPKVMKRPAIFELSPDSKYLATSDGFDIVYLLCTASKVLLKMLKHNFNIVSIVFSTCCNNLYALGANGEVTVWNLSTYRVEKRFSDQGCVNASCITISPCGKLIAIGSNEGIVNVYESSDLTIAEPTPIKCIQNLKTKITNLKFNCSSEMLAMSSSYYPNAVKLVHIPSYHIFSNFPQQSTNLYQIASVNFSPKSGYMALGNNKNCAYMYRLKHYKNY